MYCYTCKRLGEYLLRWLHRTLDNVWHSYLVQGRAQQRPMSLVKVWSVSVTFPAAHIRKWRDLGTDRHCCFTRPSCFVLSCFKGPFVQRPSRVIAPPAFVTWCYCPWTQKSLDWSLPIVRFINAWQRKSANQRKRKYQNNGTIGPIVVFLRTLPEEGGDENAALASVMGIVLMHSSTVIVLGSFSSRWASL